jgi:hypothetical protein
VVEQWDGAEAGLEKIGTFLHGWSALALLFAGVALWLGYGWWRRHRARAAASRARVAFNAKEERRWQGHRRDRSVTSIRKK